MAALSGVGTPSIAGPFQVLFMLLLHRRLIGAVVFHVVGASVLFGTISQVARAEQPLQLSSDTSYVKPPPPPATTDLPRLSFPAEPNVVSTIRPLAQDVRDETPPIPTIDLTTPPDDLWQRMRNGFSMPNLEDSLVANRQAWYLNRPDGLLRVFNRSRPYLYHIVTELEKRGMPTELALLPMVESSFNPLAYSPARAHGMWQFIPSTGKNYKLQQNAWLDQRRDIIASTNAALDYLQTIYEMHGDWHLALASYNWGEGSVGKAIARNQAKGLPTDYLSIKMPEETRYYVPKLQALKNIVAEPELFGVTLAPIPNQPFFGTVELPGSMDVALAAKLAEMPVNEFIALNPAYSRPVMPDSANSPIVLPADKVETYLANYERHTAEEKPLSSWLTHTLKKGEKLDAVAARYGIDGNKLRRMNGITQRTKVVPGLALLVPGRHTAQPEALLAQLPQTPAQPPRAAKKKGGKAGKGTKAGNRSAGKRVAVKGKGASQSTGKASSKQKGKTRR